jgi:hypothetical protein
MTHVVIGTTLTTYTMLDPDRDFLWKAWLFHADEIVRRADVAGIRVSFFVAIELDGRGVMPFAPLIARIRELSGEYWTYSLLDNRSAITQANRGRHITFGQNLISEYATSIGATHLLHMAADCEPPQDVLEKLLAVHHPLVAAECTTYCQALGNRERLNWVLRDGTACAVEQGPMTAVCVLIHRTLFKTIKWRWDPDLGMTDDPSFSHDARTLFHVDTLTRMDCVAIHHPQAIGPIETRFPGLDMSIPQE